jgi:hypothetical protein
LATSRTSYLGAADLCSAANNNIDKKKEDDREAKPPGSTSPGHLPLLLPSVQPRFFPNLKNKIIAPAALQSPTNQISNNGAALSIPSAGYGGQSNSLVIAERDQKNQLQAVLRFSVQ